MSETTLNLLQAHKRLTEYLERHGVDSPRPASEILISNALCLRRIDIYAKFDRLMSEQELETLRGLGRRLASGEPLQLIVGDCQFLSYSFEVEPGVFIPRPETEQLVETVAGMFHAAGDGSFSSILDIGTGTGVIAISLLKTFPLARAVAVDISDQAVKLAEKNGLKMGVGDRLKCVTGDLFAPPAADMKFDAVISNPPYISSGDIEELEPVVRDHDPRAALDGGEEGFDIIKKIATGAPGRLRDGGLLALEVGIGQSTKTLELLRGAGFSDCSAARDMSGVERIITGWAR